MKKRLYSFLIVIFSVIFTSKAHAITVDFSDPSFANFNNDSIASFVVDGITITMQAIANTATGEAGQLKWTGHDGFGVKFGDEMDEIDTCEEIILSFSTSILLSSVSFYDLYVEWGYPEVGYYSINGGVPVEFQAITSGSNGFLYLPLPDVLATSISFFSTPCDLRNEFALGGFSFNKGADVPEPASVMLLGTGLIAFARLRRRRG